MPPPILETDTWLEASKSFYAKCNKKELHKFIKAKKGYARSSSWRVKLLDKLEELDQSAVFQLLNLPKELRLIIFRLLLQKDKGSDKKLWPSIMTTRKSIDFETEDVLYRERPLRIGQEYFSVEAGLRKSLEIQSDIATRRWDHGGAASISDVIELFRPVVPALMKFKRIVVELAEEDKSYSSFSHLYVVASLLAVADHKVESIIVHFTNHTLLGRMPQLCWPLKSLTNVKISFSGIEPSSSHELWQFGSVDPPMVLVEWWKLNTEIENYLHLLKAARVRRPGIGVLRLQLHALSKTSRAIVRPLGMGHENDFMSALGIFRAYLRSDKLASAEADATAKLAAEGHALPQILSVLEEACRGAELAVIGTAC